MTSPAEPAPTPAGVADTAAAFTAGMAASNARQGAISDPMGGAVSLPVPDREDVYQPWSPPEPGDGGGVT